MAKTYFTMICNRTRYAESLEAFTNSFGSVNSLRAALLDCDSSTERICPGSVIKCDWLEILYDLACLNTFFVADFLCIFNGCDTILLADFVNFINTAFIAFE